MNISLKAEEGYVKSGVMPPSLPTCRVDIEIGQEIRKLCQFQCA